jgi:hypothetical protein
LATYPTAQVLAWAAIVGWSLLFGEQLDRKFTGWAAFWIGTLNISFLTVPLATVSHIVGLTYSVDRWKPLLRQQFVRLHLIAGVAHPIVLQLIGTAVDKPRDGTEVFVVTWAMVGPGITAIALWSLLSRRRRRVADRTTAA